ncbi:Transmembrane prolyl 4-hydroxylase [Phytophthora cinnamomi]|uniref:Transmembrane prolyl 4-hydroxylase n=1 Tax=Phytophthora cinnamomi TaxID=4785 RepID=UPI0035598216|nr:Transmembrane prolyl 4-hydroxylase [Phytophthora cinnamomi]
MESDAPTAAEEPVVVDEVVKDEAVVPTATAAPAVQAYRARYNETIAPPGGPPSRVIRPPNDFPPESKRADQIEDAEEDLEVDMEELKAAVHAYNVDFQARIDAVKQRGRNLEAKLGTEHEEMMSSIEQLRMDFRKQFQTAFLALEQKTLSHFAKLEAQEITCQEKKLHECESEFRTFAYTTVPEIMEKLQGTITRKLEKNHETFDIENAKIQKREKKTLHALESNERKTDASFRTETARRVAKFQEREEEFHHIMRVDNRSVEKDQSSHVQGLVALRAQLRAESGLREKEDLEILDNLSSSFGRLQASILENLGEDTTAA